MAFTKQLGSIELSTLSASAFGSASSTSWFSLQNTDKNFALMAKCGTLAGTGNLKVFLDHSFEDPTVASGVFPMVSIVSAANITASNSIATAISGATSLLPYVKIGVRCEATGAGTTTFQNIVIRLLGE